MTREPEKMPRRDLFLYWWPVVSRVLGMMIVGYAIIATHPPDAALLAVAGTALIAPNVAETQRRRNGRRDDEGTE